MSSVWEEPTDTRIVWVTLLALADQHGHVDGTVKSLARIARVSISACERAIKTLLSPDPNDRSGVDEGRRMRPETGGWLIINYADYRHRMSIEERRERDRIRKRQVRASARSPQPSANVRKVQQAEAEADPEVISNNRRREGPVFKGSRFVVMPFMQEELQRILGNDADQFQLSEWYFTLDAKLAKNGAVDTEWPWLKTELKKEARQRGLILPPSKEPARRRAEQQPIRAAWVCPHQPQCLNRNSCAILSTIRPQA